MGVAARSSWTATLHRAERYPLAVASFVLLAAVVLIAVAAPLLPLLPPDQIHLSQKLLPLGSANHYLGTDDLGRDTLSRLVWGARPSLSAGVLATLGALVPGVVVGLAAGYVLGIADTIAMRAVDMLLAFPPLLLAIAIAAGLGPGLVNAMIAVSIVGIPTYARLVRAQVLSLRELEYIEAARATGSSALRIMIHHLLPNVVPTLLVVASLDVGAKIIVTASLSFLGLGIQPPDADWGSMLARGRGFIDTAPQIVAVPGVCLAIVVLALNLMGDALRDMLDPRLRT